jgi:hypothetical protein
MGLTVMMPCFLKVSGHMDRWVVLDKHRLLKLWGLEMVLEVAMRRGLVEARALNLLMI